MFNLILATGSDFTDYALLESKLDTLLVDKHPHVRLHLGFSDPSLVLGRKFAARYGYEVVEHPGGFRGMERQLLAADAVVAFTTGKSFGITKLIEAAERRRLKVKRVLYTAGAKAIVVDGEILVPETKINRKPATTGQTVYRYDYKLLYKEAHQQWFQREYPSAWADGHYTPRPCPRVNTANGMASYIIDHAAWTGNYANRINVMGRKVKGKWIKSTTKRGTPDLDIIINSVSIKPEIKIGKDTESKFQEKQAIKIERAGGVRPIFRSIDDYFDVYYQFCKQPTLFST